MLTAKDWDEIFDAVDFYYCPPVDVDQYPDDPNYDPNADVILFDDDGNVVGFELPDTDDAQADDTCVPPEDDSFFQWVCDNEDRLFSGWGG